MDQQWSVAVLAIGVQQNPVNVGSPEVRGEAVPWDREGREGRPLDRGQSR